MNPKPENLREAIEDRFSLDEIKTLCHDLAIDKDYIAPSDTSKPKATTNLIDYCYKNNKSDALRKQCKKLRPTNDINWDSIPISPHHFAKNKSHNLTIWVSIVSLLIIAGSFLLINTIKTPIREAANLPSIQTVAGDQLISSTIKNEALIIIGQGISNTANGDLTNDIRFQLTNKLGDITQQYGITASVKIFSTTIDSGDIAKKVGNELNAKAVIWGRSQGDNLYIQVTPINRPNDFQPLDLVGFKAKEIGDICISKSILNRILDQTYFVILEMLVAEKSISGLEKTIKFQEEIIKKLKSPILDFRIDNCSPKTSKDLLWELTSDNLWRRKNLADLYYEQYNNKQAEDKYIEIEDLIKDKEVQDLLVDEKQRKKDLEILLARISIQRSQISNREDRFINANNLKLRAENHYANAAKIDALRGHDPYERFSNLNSLVYSHKSLGNYSINNDLLEGIRKGLDNEINIISDLFEKNCALLFELAFATESIDSQIQIIQNAVKGCQKAKRYDWLGYAYANLADRYASKGSISEAIDNDLLALQTYSDSLKINSDPNENIFAIKEMAKRMAWLGNWYARSDQNPFALQSYQSALQQFKHLLNNPSQQSEAFSTIQWVIRDYIETANVLGDCIWLDKFIDEEIIFFNELLQKNQSNTSKDKFMLAKINNILAALHPTKPEKRIEYLDKSSNLLKEAYFLSKNLSFLRQAAYTSLDLAKLHIQQGETLKAKKELNETIIRWDNYLVLNTNNPEGLYQKANALKELALLENLDGESNIDKSIAICNMLEKLSPDDRNYINCAANTRLGFGIKLKSNKEITKSIQYLKDALDFYSSSSIRANTSLDIKRLMIGQLEWNLGSATSISNSSDITLSLSYIDKSVENCNYAAINPSFIIQSDAYGCIRDATNTKLEILSIARPQNNHGFKKGYQDIIEYDKKIKFFWGDRWWNFDYSAKKYFLLAKNEHGGIYKEASEFYKNADDLSKKAIFTTCDKNTQKSMINDWLDIVISHRELLKESHSRKVFADEILPSHQESYYQNTIDTFKMISSTYLINIKDKTHFLHQYGRTLADYGGFLFQTSLITEAIQYQQEAVNLFSAIENPDSNVLTTWGHTEAGMALGFEKLKNTSQAIEFRKKAAQTYKRSYEKSPSLSILQSWIVTYNILIGLIEDNNDKSVWIKDKLALLNKEADKYTNLKDKQKSKEILTIIVNDPHVSSDEKEIARKNLDELNK